MGWLADKGTDKVFEKIGEKLGISEKETNPKRSQTTQQTTQQYAQTNTKVEEHLLKQASAILLKGIDKNNIATPSNQTATHRQQTGHSM